MVLIGECAGMLSCNVAGMNTVASTFNNMFICTVKGADNTLKSLHVTTTVGTSHCRLSCTGIIGWYITRSHALSRISSTLGDTYIYAFSPQNLHYMDGSVDWIVGPLDTTLVFTTRH